MSYLSKKFIFKKFQNHFLYVYIQKKCKLTNERCQIVLYLFRLLVILGA